MKETDDYSKPRITVLRELMEMSQKEFASDVGISQSALSQLENGKSKLSVATLVKISDVFEINCNWLVRGKGRIFLKDLEEGETMKVPSLHTVDIEGVSMIPLILEEAKAGYLKGCKDADYMSSLDIYKIPGYEEGNYRMFEISGDSMLPTIYPREIVISEHVDDWDKLENGTMCVVITTEDIVAKRVYFYEEDKNVLILKSDNADFKTYSINIDEVTELWEIRSKITSVFQQESSQENKRIETIQSDLQELKNQVGKLLDQK